MQRDAAAERKLRERMLMEVSNCCGDVCSISSQMRQDDRVCRGQLHLLRVCGGKCDGLSRKSTWKERALRIPPPHSLCFRSYPPLTRSLHAYHSFSSFCFPPLPPLVSSSLSLLLSEQMSHLSPSLRVRHHAIDAPLAHTGSSSLLTTSLLLPLFCLPASSLRSIFSSPLDVCWVARLSEHQTLLPAWPAVPERPRQSKVSISNSSNLLQPPSLPHPRS
eukprot:753650-Hanusia_phi.AAC.2